MRQVTSGSERRICSVPGASKPSPTAAYTNNEWQRRCWTREHIPTPALMHRFAIHPRPALSTTKSIAKWAQYSQFRPTESTNNSLWGVVNKNNALMCPFHATIWLDPSTSNLLCPIFCQPDPLPDPCCRSITTLAINLLRGETELSIHIDALVLWPLMHQSCFDSAAVR